MRSRRHGSQVFLRVIVRNSFTCVRMTGVKGLVHNVTIAKVIQNGENKNDNPPAVTL